MGVHNKAFGGLMACGQAGHILGNLRQLRFTVMQHCRRFRGLTTCFLNLLSMTCPRRIEVRRLSTQPRNGFTGIFVKVLFTLHVHRQLRNALLQRADCVFCTSFLITKRVFLHVQPLQDCIRNGLFVAQSRQGCFTNFAGLYGFLHSDFCLCCSHSPSP